MSNKLGTVRRPALDRFAEKIALTDSGCIEWIGGTNGVGYGAFYAGRSSLDDHGRVYAHRWSYEYHIGPIPEGMHLDHLCRNTLCVNPDHLEPVTCRENLLRGESPSAKHAKKTHCPQGHPYSGDNVYVHPTRGYRVCRTCNRRASLERYYRNREAS